MIVLKYLFLAVILCISVVVPTGCGSINAIEETSIDNVNTSVSNENSVQEVAFEFKTDGGEYITVVQDTTNDIHYQVPSDILDPRLTATPIQLNKGDYVIDIGFANSSIGSAIDDNLYSVIYDAIVQKYLESTKDELSDEFNAALLNYSKAYPNTVYMRAETFAGADRNDTRWSDATINLTDYTDLQEFKFPIVSVSYKLKSGEYLVAHCYATLNSGKWHLDDIPAYLDVVSSDKKVSSSKYETYILDMLSAYDNCVNMLKEELSYIHVGDLSDEYTIVSLSNQSDDNYTYGVDVSDYDAYAFVVLSDASVYLAYEKNGIKAVDCIAGDSSHNIATDWDRYDTKLVDVDSGEEYDFTWKRND